MKKLFVLIMLAFVAVGTKAGEPIRISPTLNVGDVLRYKVKSDVKIHQGKDSTVLQMVLLPWIKVVSKNETGPVIVTHSSLQNVTVSGSDPNLSKVKESTKDANDLVASISLKIQLDKYGKPVSLLNTDEVKDVYTAGYFKILKRASDTEITDEAKWKEDMMPMVKGYVDMLCKLEHLIAEQFGNTAFYNLIGIPLQNGEIPASMIINDNTQKMITGARRLNMSVSAATGDNVVVEAKGQENGNEIYGKWRFSKGKIISGNVRVKINIVNQIISSVYTVESIK